MLCLASLKKNFDVPDTKACLTKLKLEKILLERFPHFKKSWTNPWQVYLVAEKLSRLKNIPLTVLVDVCNNNAMKMYGLTN